MVVWVWVGFLVFVLAMLALDLGVFHRHAHTIKIREALVWSGVWIGLALLFNVFVYFAYEHHLLGIGRAHGGAVARDPVDGTELNGHTAAIKFFTGYVIEKSLSVDNIFVIALIFGYFRIPAMYQHRVLYWGILGALLMRGVFIALGAVLVAKFHWIIYVFGVILLYTAYKLLFGSGDPDPKNNVLIRLAHRYFPITQELHGQKLVVKRGELRKDEAVQPPGEDDPDCVPVKLPGEGRADPDCPPGKERATAGGAPAHKIPGHSAWVLTPLALALIVVEGTDLVFAVDSIPAIFAITGDAFLVFTSNVFAILGLRSLYFALAGIIDKFYYLKTALAVVLALVGVKMLVADLLKKLPLFEGNRLSFITLGMVALILGGGIVASIIRARKHPVTEGTPPPAGDGKPEGTAREAVAGGPH
ncbi:MAG TPA: TerC family protein [Tepidisphaeraceae bacterium]|nr:TerC family protein [Tepidisphaeraceae bacterium]